MTIGDNPFWVWTPEEVEAKEAYRLFVPNFSDFPAVQSPSHTFLHGPRGSGKSMMFRMMRPDCAQLIEKCPLKELKYLAIYAPIKRTEISQTELTYLDKHPARYVFNEHLLCLYFAGRICFELLSDKLEYSNTSISIEELNKWANQYFYSGFRCQGERLSVHVKNESVTAAECIRAIFGKMAGFIQDQWQCLEDLVRRLPLDESSLAKYDGPLLSFHTFLLPLLNGLRELSFLPTGPVYLLVDDADFMSRTQTEIFNSWIATRTTGTICIKASTQMRYKTRMTVGGQRIESPHDYQQVDISVLYTTNKDNYLNRLELIVQKRLQEAGLPDDVNKFFPEDPDQVKSISKIAQELKAKWAAGEGSGYRARDDANRYARPEFIRRLGGKRKATPTYSYSGFAQLAHVSSGVIRWFLEPAANMFTAQAAKRTDDKPLTFIEPQIQNEKVREAATKYLQSQMEEFKEELRSHENPPLELQQREADYHRLEFLIGAMGRTFFNILTDEKRSERRVFSIALSDRPDEDVQRVLTLGVQEGYFHRTTIGTKTGHGRTTRYVLSRRLAPFFNLDPTSFSGYLFVTNENLRNAMLNPKALLRDVSEEDIQMELPINQP